MGVTRAEEEQLTEECKQLLSSLPKERGWRTSHLYQYQGFWCQPAEIQAIVSFQNHFQAYDNDIILATMPKSGTTWLKALAFAVVNRDHFPVDSDKHPLLTSNPHDLVPFLEYKIYANNQIPDLSKLSADDQDRPRLFGTHIPFPSLANSVKKSNSCRVVYLCRNPFDTFISSWHFIGSMSPFTLEEAFEMCCRGVIGFGPFWDHMLGYWKESLARPENVLFLTYEDLKEDAVFHLKRLAKFLGRPFSFEEETSGLVEKIAKLCSFENLKGLEVNKKGKSIKNFENNKLFRKGEVGDWVNYLSPLMVEKMSTIMEEKLGDSGLKFKVVIS
ncbi:Flavonol sulfotransferase-like protein [Morus notabilis]|uniref:Sulfotransferase n=1 Tax=Morus notabilis TaxID=981085 RepID=W9RB35_9ROSA|nr:cytosolic sulfotransferase 15 [Morus notabilis]EXB62672.1 Flavonol sulfotransferase-like protein [Morus notabilis]